MKLNRNQVKHYLQNFEFTTLFIEELGWDYPQDRYPLYITVAENNYTLKRVAEKRGFVVFHCLPETENFPDGKIRKKIDGEITPYSREHLIIYTDQNQDQQIWQYVKYSLGKDGVRSQKAQLRETTFNVKQSGELLIQNLEKLVIDFTEEENLTLVDVIQRTQKAFDIEKVTKKFFEQFQLEHRKFVDFIQGIDDPKDVSWYASVILNRLMFIYFLQKKGFLDRGNTNYLQDHLKASQSQEKNLYYTQFLQTLFFEGFGKQKHLRSQETQQLIGDIKYLNGGLFLPHQIEEKYHGQITISDEAFADIFALFSSYTWHLDDTPSGKDDEINPDVLGYIFEKYINQKAFGAYYTKPEITNYLCERTINKFITEKIISSQVSSLSLSEILHDQQAPVDINLIFNHLDNPLCNLLLDDILPHLSILDPACGSGAFLVAALQHLIKIYTAIFNSIEIHGDQHNQTRLGQIKTDHPSLEYYIKKRIVTDNLYGVDIMEEATEIAKLRLFLSLVASAKTVDDLEPLPNVDFNIMPGNSLIGLIRIDGSAFDSIKHPSPVGEGGQGDSIQGSFLPLLAASEYQRILAEKNESIKKYKEHAFKPGEISGTDQDSRLQMLRDHIEKVNRESLAKLNQLLLNEFSIQLGIKYEEVQLKGKPKKRLLTLADIHALKPFHWGYHFDEIISKGGFDIILGNPPWETFKPQAKEFFAEYSNLVTKNKMDIKTFEKEQEKLLENDEIASAWSAYQSQYPHVSLYFRNAEQYKNQISVVNGKKQGTDINLYKLFVEQCVNLLSKNGECGLVIPSGIYTDLGTKQLREMLFLQTKITGLFCFENRKNIFEGVDSRFKFVILTFENGGDPPQPPLERGEYLTQSFPAKFMRHEVSELHSFPGEDSINISVDLIKYLSPDSLSVMEFKSDLDIKIAQKMSQFPLLGEEIEDQWNLKLTNEFHMTNDSHLFKTEPGKGRLPLYEGKMIHQFNHKFAQPRYWIDEVEGRKAVLGKNGIDNGQILDYQCYRLCFRDVARNTDIRTMIATTICKNIFCGNTLIVSKQIKNLKELLTVSALLNSFICDFIIRQKVTAHCNMFYIYQLPVPRLTEKDQYFQEIVERSAKLICTTPEYDELAKEVGLGNHQNGVTDETERAKLRAEIDGMVAHIYGLTETELSHILNSFPIVSETVKQGVLKAYRDL